jgi:hypothetical protein
MWKLRGLDKLNAIHKENKWQTMDIFEIIQPTNKEKTYEY